MGRKKKKSSSSASSAGLRGLAESGIDVAFAASGAAQSSARAQVAKDKERKFATYRLAAARSIDQVADLENISAKFERMATSEKGTESSAPLVRLVPYEAGAGTFYPFGFQELMSASTVEAFDLESFMKNLEQVQTAEITLVDYGAMAALEAYKLLPRSGGFLVPTGTSTRMDSGDGGGDSDSGSGSGDGAKSEVEKMELAISGLRRHNARSIVPAELEAARRVTVASRRKRELTKEKLSRLQKSGASNSAEGREAVETAEKNFDAASAEFDAATATLRPVGQKYENYRKYNLYQDRIAKNLNRILNKHLDWFSDVDRKKILSSLVEKLQSLPYVACPNFAFDKPTAYSLAIATCGIEFWAVVKAFLNKNRTSWFFCLYVAISPRRTGVRNTP